MKPASVFSPSPRLYFWLCLGFITVLSFATYVVHYERPAAFFWDENYHIAAAQKYLNNVYFMEQHPPLGKLLIAAGESLLDRNPVDNQYVNTDYARNPPDGFSFAGYRLFPTLLAWLTAPILFLCFWLLGRNLAVATFGSFLYAFDNAIIVHSRGAMLESTLMFFSAATILGFLLMLENASSRKLTRWSAALFGAAFAGAMTTKVVALILVLLIPALIWLLWNKRHALTRGLGVAALAFGAVYCLVWNIHFSLGSNLEPRLSNNGYYETSESGRQILAEGRNGTLLAFPTMLSDSLQFVTRYNEGVPELDLCKDDENGSPFFFWPIGARSINYRWETGDGGATHRHLYLQNNPVIWGIGLLSLIVTASLLIGRTLTPEAPKLKHGRMMFVFSVLYVGYMAAISQLDRVMYLYHYFTPLLFSFFLAVLLLLEVTQIGRFRLTNERRNIIILILCAYIVAGWHFFHGFTYYEPMTKEQVQARAWLDIWDLHCVGCDHTNYVFNPR